MTIHDIITDYDAQIDLLRIACKEFDFADPIEDPVKLALNLIETMYHYNGLGLAAPQIRYLTRAFSMRGTMDHGDFACFNPRIVHFSEEQIVLEEGCLSYPNLFVKIRRPRHVRLRFASPSGEILTQQFTGMTARVVQHEMDHLDGIVFYSRANKYHKDLGFRQRGKNVQKNNKMVPPFELFAGK
jgi:peptide deformylase